MPWQCVVPSLPWHWVVQSEHGVLYIGPMFLVAFGASLVEAPCGCWGLSSANVQLVARRWLVSTWLAVFDGTTFGSMFTLQSACCVLKVSQCEMLCLALLVAFGVVTVRCSTLALALQSRCVVVVHPQLRSLLLRLV